MGTKKTIVNALPETNGYVYRQEVGMLWELLHRGDDGEERYLMPCYLERENNRGWTFKLAYTIASTQPKAFLSRGEWVVEE